MYQKTLSVFLAFVAMFFLGWGITGFTVIGDAPVGDVVEHATQGYIATSLGVLILFILAIVGYLEWKQGSAPQKRSRKR
ncbi:hypothetical protein HZA98_04595 [Candidatus Woesearchaeota archaeon]|nr:hypothetical protein [Candidatus Woesearchaeota archaeon]